MWGLPPSVRQRCPHKAPALLDDVVRHELRVLLYAEGSQRGAWPGGARSGKAAHARQDLCVLIDWGGVAGIQHLSVLIDTRGPEKGVLVHDKGSGRWLTRGLARPQLAAISEPAHV